MSRKPFALIWLIPLIFASASWLEFFKTSKTPQPPSNSSDAGELAANPTTVAEGVTLGVAHYLSTRDQPISNSDRYAGLTRGEVMRRWIAIENSNPLLDAEQAAAQQALLTEMNATPQASVAEVGTLLGRIPESDTPDRLAALKLVQKLGENPEARESVKALLTAEMGRVIQADAPSGDENPLYLSASLYLELANDSDQKFKFIDSALLVQRQPWVLDYLQGLRASLVTKYSGQQLMRGVAGAGVPTEQPVNNSE